MSEQEFLDALKRTPREWSVNGLLIRGKLPTEHEYEERCPITAVIRHRLGKCVHAGDALLVGTSMLGLDDPLVRRILKAADGPLDHEHEEKRLRSRLLEACGIKERAT